MRTDKELITLLRDTFKEYGGKWCYHGISDSEYESLCFFTARMRCDVKIFDCVEEIRADKLVHTLKPRKKDNAPYFYPLNEQGYKNRLELLDKLIKKLS